MKGKGQLFVRRIDRTGEQTCGQGCAHTCTEGSWAARGQLSLHVHVLGQNREGSGDADSSQAIRKEYLSM